MTAPFELQIPPWRTPALWRAVNDAMAAAVDRHAPRLKSAIILAMRLERHIAELEDIMDALCAANCPGCRDSCCRRATVWYDFKDLVCLHLKGALVPVAQIITAADQSCPYQTDTGCTLPRTARPFICTWYLCPVQKVDLQKITGAAAGSLIETLNRVKLDRSAIENLFIQGIMA